MHFFALFYTKSVFLIFWNFKRLFGQGQYRLEIQISRMNTHARVSLLPSKERAHKRRVAAVGRALLREDTW